MLHNALEKRALIIHASLVLEVPSVEVNDKLVVRRELRVVVGVLQDKSLIEALEEAVEEERSREATHVRSSKNLFLNVLADVLILVRQSPVIYALDPLREVNKREHLWFLFAIMQAARALISHVRVDTLHSFPNGFGKVT